jgi:cytoskeleton-associated protein 5
MSAKWKERKEALEGLLTLIDHPKLEDGKYYELINVLAKKIQDPNVVVLVLAAGCLEKLALGLRDSFGQYRNIVLEPLLERMKEKKTNVVAALRNALDALFESIRKLSDVQEDIIVHLSHSSPSIRQETLEFVTRAFKFKRVVKDLPKGDLKKFMEAILKCMDDSIPAVRESGVVCLANAMVLYGEKVVSVYIDRLEKLKLQKVMDCYNSIKITKLAVKVVKTLSAKVVTKNVESAKSESRIPSETPKVKTT